MGMWLEVFSTKKIPQSPLTCIWAHLINGIRDKWICMKWSPLCLEIQISHWIQVLPEVNSYPHLEQSSFSQRINIKWYGRRENFYKSLFETKLVFLLKVMLQLMSEYSCHRGTVWKYGSGNKSMHFNTYFPEQESKMPILTEMHFPIHKEQSYIRWRQNPKRTPQIRGLWSL